MRPVLWPRSLGSPERPVERCSNRKAKGCRQGVDHKIFHSGVPARRKELQHFDQPGEGDDAARREQAVARMGQSEREPEQHEGKPMLTVLSQV